MVTFQMSVTRPCLQGGAGEIAASLGTCQGFCAGGHCLFIGLVWSPGGSAEQNHRVAPMAVLSWFMAPRWGLAQGQGFLQHPWFWVMSAIPEFAWSLLQHDLCAQSHSLPDPQPCSAFPSSTGLFNPAKHNFENFGLSAASCNCVHLLWRFQPQVNEGIVN